MSKSAKRFDVGTISRAQRTPQGFLRAPAFATKVGVFKYQLPDGSIRREYRPPEEVFNPASMQTLAGIPLTNKHPAKLLSPQNAMEHTVGYTGDNVEADKNFVSTSVTIVDGPTINEVMSGAKQELSCGYVCDLDDTPGIYEGEAYDCVQRNIIYNHLAIVGKGRAGPQVKLHLDADDAVMVENENPKEGTVMEKVTLDGAEHEMSPEAAKAVKGMLDKHADGLKKMSDKHDDMIKKHDDMKDKHEKMVKEMDEMSKKITSPQAAAEQAGANEETKKALDETTAKKDALEEEVKSLKEKTSGVELSKLVKARMTLETAAKAAGVQKFDEMSDLDIKKAVIAAKSKTDLTGKTETYIDARFDGICETLQGAGVAAVVQALMPMGSKAGSSVHMDTEVPNADEIKKKRMDEDAAAWQVPTGKTREQVLAKNARRGQNH